MMLINDAAEIGRGPGLETERGIEDGSTATGIERGTAIEEGGSATRTGIDRSIDRPTATALPTDVPMTPLLYVVLLSDVCMTAFCDDREWS